MTESMHEVEERGPSRALIIAAQTPAVSEMEVLNSCEELKALAETLGMEVLGVEVQRRKGTKSSHYLGTGKLNEIAGLTGGPGVDGELREEGEVESEGASVEMILVDGELSPRQQQILEEVFDVPVMDRTAVILRIFEERAQTREARLQVELARLNYNLPRLRELAGTDDRQGGGGRGERGHTNVELAKSQTRDRIAQLRAELKTVQEAEGERRKRRQSAYQVALVGYTNAGKSSLMRALTGSEVLVEDKLFATLGTTVRQLHPPTTPQILISDTVGFIKNLPHELVASFRSTLEEAKEADFLLIVVDCSDHDRAQQERVTRDTLASIGVEDVPTRVVFNKIDRLGQEDRELLRERHPGALEVSALDEASVEKLREAIVRQRDESLGKETLLIPYQRGELVGEIHRIGRVLEEKHVAEGTEITFLARKADQMRLKDALKTKKG